MKEKPDGDEPPSCEYIGSTGMGIETEVEHENAVWCRGTADVVLRPARGDLRDIADPMTKVQVCRRHGRWLVTSEEVEREWEQCGEVE